jgi:hypothetical protein
MGFPHVVFHCRRDDCGGHAQGQLGVDVAHEEGPLGVGGHHIRPPHTTHTALHHQSLLYMRHQQDVTPVRGFLP